MTSWCTVHIAGRLLHLISKPKNMIQFSYLWVIKTRHSSRIAQYEKTCLVIWWDVILTHIFNVWLHTTNMICQKSGVCVDTKNNNIYVFVILHHATCQVYVFKTILIVIWCYILWYNTSCNEINKDNVDIFKWNSQTMSIQDSKFYISINMSKEPCHGRMIISRYFQLCLFHTTIALNVNSFGSQHCTPVKAYLMLCE
jgi:hypothetical protein